MTKDLKLSTFQHQLVYNMINMDRIARNPENATLAMPKLMLPSPAVPPCTALLAYALEPRSFGSVQHFRHRPGS